MIAVQQEAVQQVVGGLDMALRQQVLDLADQVRRHDGVEAISEAPLLALADGDPAVTHILAWKNGALAGYCQRDVAGASAELAVAPGARRLGLAKAIVRTLAVDTPKVRLWAHGDLGAARLVADSVGLVAVRELWEMTADRRARPHPDSPPSEWVFRPFDPRVDRVTWVELNAAAFANHPEQGRLTVEDLDRRMAESWFDPAGLIFAAPIGVDGRPGQPLGFVWNKVIDGGGEVYAIGVHPHAQGRRLGTKLLEVGLKRMEGQG
ncbi:MAG: mycothiol synthase, partial [Bifidobacteriaceae bacterium]|nr:mycothiol synthase [Bifidobacteriaceae bacterium]